VLPRLAAARRLPSEDAVVLERGRKSVSTRVLVACPILPRIANFDDLDPLKLESEIEVAFIPPDAPIPAEAALVVLPGSKATIADLAAVRQFGWDVDIAAHRRRGGAILGICGGYQMLGRVVADPLGIEGAPGAVAGLGMLDVETELRPLKALRRVSGRAWDAGFSGYEMHMGITTGPDAARWFARLDDGASDGAVSADGRVIGTYCHGLLASTELRVALLSRLGAASRGADYAAGVEEALDAIAAEVERHVDVDGLIALASKPP
jgi:adenosylcobyric acid synthase